MLKYFGYTSVYSKYFTISYNSGDTLVCFNRDAMSRFESKKGLIESIIEGQREFHEKKRSLTQEYDSKFEELFKKYNLKYEKGFFNG